MIPRKLFIYHPTHFETWGPRTPDERGIGNSETAHIELARRFAQRGWEVTSYAPLPEGESGMHDGVMWLPLEQANAALHGYWMIFRTPESLDAFPAEHPNQRVVIVSQDESYRGRWNDERAAKLDMLFALCEHHKASTESDHPGLKGKVVVSSNGIKMDLVRAADAAGVERNPHRLMWASSPDRGLLRLLKIFRRVREWVSDAELHVFYGFENIDKLIAMGPQFAHFKKIKADIMKLADQPGVVWHGRTPQPELLVEWAKSAVICYPTTFQETSCATLMEAQAMGAIPVVSPVWALAENTVGGIFIEGHPEQEMVSARFVGEVYRLLSNVGLQEQIRGPMMQDARNRFQWARQVDKYEAHLLGYADHAMHQYQFAFQLKYAKGPCIANVGCAGDPADFKSIADKCPGFTVVNVDVATEDPIFGRPTKADILADCRTMELGMKFDTMVFGDILEHFPVEEVPAILRRAARHLWAGGRIVVTVPDDRRPVDRQHAGSDGSEQYAPGVCACHDHPLPESIVRQWFTDAGLEIAVFQKLECDYFDGHGIVAVIPNGEAIPNGAAIPAEVGITIANGAQA